jgi:hypothetical protein
MSTDSPEFNEQRLCKRLNLDFLVSIEHPDGSILEGITIDLSLGGLKVACETVPGEKWVGAEVTLMLLNPAFPETPFECKVQRLENKLMALSLANSCVPRFGLAVGKDQFKRSSTME